MIQLSYKQQSIIDKFVTAIQQLDGVNAIVLGGSFASGTAKSDSDIDIAIYYSQDNPFSIGALQQIARNHNDDKTIKLTDFGGWGRWVNGGGWLNIDGQQVDFLYRDLVEVEQIITDCENGKIELDYHQQPATGFYSYMYLAETHICKILYQADDQLSKLKARVSSYPPKLRQKILKDLKWMAEFALTHARKAISRFDTYTFIACLSRYVSYIIQLIFAVNEVYFISDKGAVEKCAKFPITVPHFQERVEDIFFKPDAGSINQCEYFLQDLSPHLK